MNRFPGVDYVDFDSLLSDEQRLVRDTVRQWVDDKFKPLIEECKRENCRDAMVDARQLQVEFDTIALFRAGVDAAAMNEFGLRVALIAREDMISSFFDDVIYNRAAQVQVFTDPQSAEAWIKERRQVEAA